MEPSERFPAAMTLWKRSLAIVLGIDFLISLVPSIFLLYVAYQHNSQGMYHDEMTGDIELGQCLKFLFMNMAVIFGFLRISRATFDGAGCLR